MHHALPTIMLYDTSLHNATRSAQRPKQQWKKPLIRNVNSFWKWYSWNQKFWVNAQQSLSAYILVLSRTVCREFQSYKVAYDSQNASSLVYTYDANISTSIIHVWTETTQAKGDFICGAFEQGLRPLGGEFDCWKLQRAPAWEGTWGRGDRVGVVDVKNWLVH